MKNTLFSLILFFFAFSFAPTSKMSHGAQITQEVVQQVEPAETASRAVGSGGWIGSFDFWASLFALICLGIALDIAFRQWPKSGD